MHRKSSFYLMRRRRPKPIDVRSTMLPAGTPSSSHCCAALGGFTSEAAVIKTNANSKSFDFPLVLVA